MRLGIVNLKYLMSVETDFLCYRYPLASPELRASIAKNGLIEPLVIRDGTDTQPPLLVCGHRRAWEMQVLNYQGNIPVIWLDAKVKTIECFRRSLIENDPKTLNLAERARALRIGLRLNMPVLKVMKEIGLAPSYEL